MLTTIQRNRLHAQRGFSLVEMMIAVTVGLVVLAGVTQIFATSVGSAADTRKLARVNADLRTAMDLMVHEIQRAGYSSTAVNAAANTVQTTTNPFTQGDNALKIGAGGSCITFTYDDGNDGVPDIDEDVLRRQDVHAFYLNNNTINKRRNGSAGAADSCTPGTVEGITDPNRVLITSLQFAMSASDERCLNVTAIPPRACATDPPPVVNDILVKTRPVTITIIGRPIEDATMLRTITNTVRVRNDLVCLKGSDQCP